MLVSLALDLPPSHFILKTACGQETFLIKKNIDAGLEKVYHSQ
jgi:hypothetical protein